MTTSGPGGERIRVLLVDHQGMFVESLDRMLGDEDYIEVVGSANSCADAVRLAERLRPSVAVVDSWLHDGDGVSAAAAIRRASPQTRILLLMESSDSRLVTSAIEAGCSGTLTKDQSVRELVAALHLAHAGEAYLSPEVLAALLPQLDRRYRALGFDLTVREHEVLQLMAAGGLANKDLADRLHLSLHTVRNHVQNVLAKLGAHSKLEAVVIAAREGLLDRPGQNL
jgi:DNA-binding NarL/FixJ family response regulator